LALTAKLFDPVPLDQMTAAEQAVQEAAAHIPAEVRARLGSADKLTDEDRKTIVEIARQALAPFQPKPEPEAQASDAPAAKTEQGLKPKVGPDTKPKAEASGGPRPDAPTSPKRRAKRRHE
jgi:F-type H+-transporting ATPase subunit alpha